MSQYNFGTIRFLGHGTSKTNSQKKLLEDEESAAEDIIELAQNGGLGGTDVPI